MSDKPSKKKPNSKRTLKVDRHKNPRLVFHVGADLEAAFRTFVTSSSPVPSDSAVCRAALEEYLGKRGFWPPPDFPSE